jgi:hypothetical protein
MHMGPAFPAQMPLSDDGDPFTGDYLRHIVTRKGRTDFPRLNGDAFMLRFHLRNAGLFSFQVADRDLRPEGVELAEPGGRGAP